MAKMEIIPKPKEYDFPSKFAKLSTGITMHYIELMPSGVPRATILCGHGFPDCWFGYRKVIAPLAKLGFRVIVPDQLGYGQTDAPKSSQEYQMKNCIAQNFALLDHLNIHKVILFGHDWSGTMVWTAALSIPERLLGVIGVCTPFFAIPKEDPFPKMLKNPGRFDYQLYFQSAQAETELNKNPYETMKMFLRKYDELTNTNGELISSPEPRKSGGLFKHIDPKTVARSSFLSEPELQYYGQCFKKSGFFGPLSWYRNVTNNWNFQKTFKSEIVPKEIPCLMITAENDYILRPTMVESTGMRKYVQNLTVENIEDAGHWVLQEQPQKVVAVVEKFLNKNFGATKQKGKL